MNDRRTEPDLVLIKADQLRADCLGCMGHPLLRSPAIDDLARRGQLFEQAFTVSPLCVPSRVACFSGRYPHRSRAVDNSPSSHLGGGEWSLFAGLAQAGYRCGLAGKNHAFDDEHCRRHLVFREEYDHHGKTHGTITAGDRAVRDWLCPDGAPRLGGLIEGPLPFPESLCPCARIADDAIRFIQDADPRPFALHLSFPDPHWPNVAPEPYHSLYDPDELQLEAADADLSQHPFALWVQSQVLGFDRYDASQRSRILAAYLAQVSFLDAAIGRFLSVLRRSERGRQALIVFTSDHGDFAGRFGLVEKTKSFADPLLRIPLIIAGPQIAPGRRHDCLVSNIDLAPTLCDLLRLPPDPGIQGRSLLRVLRGETRRHRDEIVAEVGSPEPPPVPPTPADYPRYAAERSAREGPFWFICFTTRGRAAALRADGWKYCFYCGDREELYDLERDPLELRNLAQEPGQRERRDRMRERLLAWLLSAPLEPASALPAPPAVQG